MDLRLANFIIGGTEKAGTTSVFSYLSKHPQVTVSKHKETNFFRTEWKDATEYARHFPDTGGRPILLEASPGYLGEAEHVAPRMKDMVPDVRLLFILREPIDRFLSSFHFHRARLNLPRDLSFHQYLKQCLSYSEGDNSRVSASATLDEWYLKVLEFGCYAKYLKRYFALFPREQIRVAFYDDLRTDPEKFMRDLSEFIGIDARFWSTASFEPQNVTYSARSQWLHRIALVVNDRIETVLRPRPRLKESLLELYKCINGARDEERSLSEADRTRLESFYGPANCELALVLGTALPAGWTQPESKVQAQLPAPAPVDVALIR